MITSHALARELLAGPDLPIFHFDPSRAGADPERDSSLSVPDVEVNDPREGLTKLEIEDLEANGHNMGKFITLSGAQSLDGEVLARSDLK